MTHCRPAVEPPRKCIIGFARYFTGQSKGGEGRVLLPKGWPRPEILSVKTDNRPSEPDLVNSGVGIGDVLQG